MTIASPDLAKLSADLAKSIPASVESARRPIPELICRASLIDLAWQVKTMAGLIELHAMQAGPEPLTQAAAATWSAMMELRRVVKELAAQPAEASTNA